VGPGAIPASYFFAIGRRPSAIDHRPSTRYNSRVLLSIVLITFNEEENLPRTLKSVEGVVRDLGGEIIVVDSGSTDRTVDIAKSFGAKVFVEEWKGFAAQKNSAIEKAGGDWVLLLDADEDISEGLAKEIREVGSGPAEDGFGSEDGYWLKRQNEFLGRRMSHGGFWPDPKLRLFRRGKGHVESRAVHETVLVEGRLGTLDYPIIHHAYPTLTGYIEHMNRYSSLGAEMAGPRSFSLLDIFIRPRLTFFYNYFLRLGFLDGREGFLLHYYHSIYVSWKYAKAWELSKKLRLKNEQ
jgi:glycosyltransferase involved in cell wall biosynthesis